MTRLTTTLLFFCTVLLTTTIAAAGGTIHGRVVGVADGDTLTLLTSENRQVKVRLAEIDAPEKNQAFGQKSKQSLSELVFGKDVSVNVQTTDRYKREVGRVYADKVDVNAEQLRRGMAWVYVQYAKDKEFPAFEASARQEKRGLWADAAPVAPWQFRRGEKSARTEPPRAVIKTGTKIGCGPKKYCKEMSSCDEAKHYLAHCGLKTLDADSDGVPCELLCIN